MAVAEPRPASGRLGGVVFSADEIATRVANLGTSISNDYRGRTPVLIAVLSGTFMFMADLVRNMNIPLELDFMAVSQFGPRAQTDEAVQVVKDLTVSIRGRHVLIVDDLIDTGLTLNYLLQILQSRGPSSLDICVLLDRPQRRLVDIPLSYVGFEAPDDFLVGYGLHYRQQFRQLPDLVRLKLPKPGG